MATTTVAPKTKTTGGSFLLEDHQLDNVFTPEDFNEDQQMVAKLADEFATNEVLPAVERIEHKDWQVTRESAEEGRRDGTDQRRCARGIRRLRHGQGFVRHHRRPHGQVRQLRGLHGRTRRHWHAAYRLLRHREQKKKYLPKLASG
jgi:hypothetical protein